MFVSDIERRVWRCDRNQGSIEIALDTGAIVAGRERLAARELELELKAGAPTALVDLARELMQAAPLRLAFESKAARGWRMLDDTIFEPRRWTAPTLDARGPAIEGFRALARAALAQVADNLQVLGEIRRPEAVHQARVGLRRLRSMQAAFADRLTPAASKRIEAELKWLAGELDCARDLDVFARETFAPATRVLAPHGLAALGLRLELARDRAYGRIEAALATPRFDRLLLETLAWIEADVSLVVPAEPSPPLAEAGAAALERLRKSVRKRGRGFDDLDATGRHKLRIRAKRLRYAADAFAPLFEGHDKRRRDLMDALAAMQAALGGLNDLQVAREGLAPDLGADNPAVALAAGRVIGRREADEPNLLAAAAKSVKRFARARPFWR